MHLNDLSISSSHLEMLVPDVTESPLIPQHFSEIEVAPVKDEIRTLMNSSRKMKSSLAVSAFSLAFHSRDSRFRRLGLSNCSTNCCGPNYALSSPMSIRTFRMC